MAGWLGTPAALPEDMNFIPSTLMVTRFQGESSALFWPPRVLHGTQCTRAGRTWNALTKKTNTFGISPRLRQRAFWGRGWPPLWAGKSVWWSVFDWKLKGGNAARVQRSHSILPQPEGIVINISEELRDRTITCTETVIANTRCVNTSLTTV